MTEHSTPSPDWSAAAASAASALGLATPLAAMPAPDWERVAARVAQDLAASGVTLPPGWQTSLAHAAGRPEAAELARDEADAVLAEKGEVFAPEDDA